MTCGMVMTMRRISPDLAGVPLVWRVDAHALRRGWCAAACAAAPSSQRAGVGHISLCGLKF